MTSRQLEISGRISEPLYLAKGATSYKVTTWEHAISTLVERMKAAGPERSFSTPADERPTKPAFCFECSPSFRNKLCQQLLVLLPSGKRRRSWHGDGYRSRHGQTGRSESYGPLHSDRRKSVIEPSEANPIADGDSWRGGKIIVINPLKELGLTSFRVPSDVRSLLFGTKIASDYIQPHIGGDLALLTGISKDVIERGGHDQEFVAEHTEGFDDFVAQVKATSWESIVEQSGVDRESIRKIADQYCKAKNVVIGWCMGITHHLHGTRSVHAIANLALLRGMVGRAHAGLMPIRGHSNVQGLGTVGVTPALKQNLLERFEKTLGIEAPKSPVLTPWLAWMRRTKAGWILRCSSAAIFTEAIRTRSSV